MAKKAPDITPKEADQDGIVKNSDRFKIRIISPFETYFDGEAVSLSATNSTGPFDILYGHINFFSLVDEGVVKVDTGFQKLEFNISKGIIRVNKETVTLFANI